MRYKSYSWIVVLLIVLVPELVFAQRDFYTPKSLIIPLHDEEKQLFASLGRGGGFDLNLSYTFTSKLALFSTATIDVGNKKRSTLMGSKYNIHKDDYTLKGGLGYFTKLDNRLWTNFEAFVGVGTSKIDNYWHFTNNMESIEYTQANYWSAFAQLNAGRKKLNSDYAIGLRFTYSNYTDFRFFDDHPNLNYIKSSYKNLHGLSADPVMSYSYNLKKIKINAQAGLAFPITKPSITQIDTHTTYDGTTPIITQVSSEEKVFLVNVLGRLSIQYTLDFKPEK